MTIDATANRNRVRICAAAFFGGVVGAAILSRGLELGDLAMFVVMIVPMTLLIPLVRAVNRQAAESGCGSPAARAYNQRMVIASFIYAIALFGAVMATEALAPHGVLAWLLAILPAIPIFLMLRAMARYLVEEQDEYLRLRVINAALIATGMLLALATVWGFLETFGLVVHVPSWAAVPVWSIGLAVGQFVTRIRG